MFNKRGFTLVELLVVMAIIAILAIAGFSSYEGTKKSARDGRRKTDLENIRGALELYFADEKAYPSGLPANCGDFITGPNLGDPNYLKMPCDPLTNTSYSSGYSSTGNSYSIQWTLERENSEDTCGSGNLLDYCVTNP